MKYKEIEHKFNKQEYKKLQTNKFSIIKYSKKMKTLQKLTLPMILKKNQQIQHLVQFKLVFIKRHLLLDIKNTFQLIIKL